MPTDVRFAARSGAHRASPDLVSRPAGGTVSATCPGCGGQASSRPYRIARQPVLSNQLLETPRAARSVRRKDIVLIQCAACGLIFNSTFDARQIEYEQGYDNRQSFSPAFRRHMADLAAELVTCHNLRGKRILEVGCGQGDFLTLICEQAGMRGVGYDSAYRGPRTRLGGRVRFFDRYVEASDISAHFDVVVCRHVVEHIGAIGGFLTELAAIAETCGAAVTVIETPNFEWTAENACFWDVFYEHCNYFTRPSLAYLCRRAGFSIARQRLAFGGQYQVLADDSANLPWAYWSPVIGNVDPQDADKVAQIPTKFDFAVKDHITLGKELDLIDTQRGTETSGSRGYYLKNEAVLIQYGLLWLAIKKLQDKGFTLFIPPVLVREFALQGSGHFPAGRGEIYQVGNAASLKEEAGKEPTFLAGTSEPSLLA